MERSALSALSQVVGQWWGEPGIVVTFEGSELLRRDVGPRFVILKKWLPRFSGGHLAVGQFVLGSTLGLALAGAVLGGGVSEQGVLLEEGEKVVVSRAHLDMDGWY